MRVRMIKKPEITGWSDRFNTHGLGEIIVGYDDGDMSSEYIKDYEVQLENGVWLELSRALRCHIVVTDNYMDHFREVKTEEEYEKGYYL